MMMMMVIVTVIMLCIIMSPRVRVVRHIVLPLLSVSLNVRHQICPLSPDLSEILYLFLSRSGHWVSCERKSSYKRRIFFLNCAGVFVKV